MKVSILGHFLKSVHQFKKIWGGRGLTYVHLFRKYRKRAGEKRGKKGREEVSNHFCDSEWGFKAGKMGGKYTHFRHLGEGKKDFWVCREVFRERNSTDARRHEYPGFVGKTLNYGRGLLYVGGESEREMV